MIETYQPTGLVRQSLHDKVIRPYVTDNNLLLSKPAGFRFPARQTATTATSVTARRLRFRRPLQNGFRHGWPPGILVDVRVAFDLKQPQEFFLVEPIYAHHVRARIRFQLIFDLEIGRRSRPSRPPTK